MLLYQISRTSKRKVTLALKCMANYKTLYFDRSSLEFTENFENLTTQKGDFAGHCPIYIKLGIYV